MVYTNQEIIALTKCLEEDIEVLLEEFEELLLRKVTLVTVTRLEFDPPIHGDTHEYRVKVEIE